MATAPVWASTAPIAFIHPLKERNKSLGKSSYGNSRLVHCRAISKLLLESIELPPAGRDNLGPIWAKEANHRVQSLLELMSTLQQGNAAPRVVNIWGAAHESAKRMIDAYHALEYYDPCQMVPCEEVIQNIVSGLVAVFRSTCGCMELAIHTRPLDLQARKRRALALLIGELVISMLLDGAQRKKDVSLKLSFSQEANGNLDISVETSCPLSHSFVSAGHGIISALAGVLETEIVYGEVRNGGTRVKLLTPI